jgi:hypothetical protein
MVIQVLEESSASIVKIEKDTDQGEMYECKCSDRGRSPYGTSCSKESGKEVAIVFYPGVGCSNFLRDVSKYLPD